jgi:hypothetical protein
MPPPSANPKAYYCRRRTDQYPERGGNTKITLWYVTVALVMVAGMAMPATAAVYYGSSTPQIITKGDAFSVSGTGATNGTVAVWVIGRNYFEVRTSAPDRHGNFTILFKPTETAKFATGQYAVVFQDPGLSGTMEIEPGRDTRGNLTIMNRGKIIARIGAKEDLKGNVQEETGILTSSAKIQSVDDTFVPEFFFVEDPSVQFDQLIPGSGNQLPERISGDRIVITGTTNIDATNTLLAELRDRDTRGIVTSRTIPIIAGSSLNTWSWVFEEPGLEPGNYLLSVGLTGTNISGTSPAWFAVRKPAGTLPPVPSTTVQEEVPLPGGLDTLLIIGILCVIALAIYAFGGKK